MRVEVLKKTNDIFYTLYTIPHYPDPIKPGYIDQRIVKVVFERNLDSDVPEWGVYVHADDDWCFDFWGHSEKECWCKFLEVIGMEYVDVTPLRELGFSGN